MTLTFLSATALAAAAAATESEGSELGSFIAAGIAAAVFLLAAIVLRSFRDVAHRTAGDVHGSDHA